jgi:hypothetical protein
MSRVFIGVGHGGQGGSDVYVEQNGKRQRLTRRVKRVHEGYSWDQMGPRSTELARAILWVVTGMDPPWALYRGFTSDVVAHLPVPICEGECWRLSEAEVEAWLHNVGWTTTGTQGEHTAQVKVSQRARRTWEDRAGSAANLFGSRSVFRLIGLFGKVCCMGYVAKGSLPNKLMRHML